MIKLIPEVKQLSLNDGFINKRAIYFDKGVYDYRVENALSKIPFDDNGIVVDIAVSGDVGEEYELWISEEKIKIEASGWAGAFYAIQTLRQIFKNEKIPCLSIKDKPDFGYRGFYHDATRGKVPTVATVKKLIDQMAYYKLNSLQLYVEHTYEFAECRELNKVTGYLTKEEIEEIDAYCYDNFIEFVPSIATFGHMYEILQQDKYKHLRVLDDFEEVPNFWDSRMGHHTIDPLNSESLDLVKSLIDQYYPLFKTDKFNICCDETFDLKEHKRKDLDKGKMYVEFVKKIIIHLKDKNKTIMMWADILLQHPEVIEELPEDTWFLNWDYSANPSEEKIIKFEELQRKQIVCPGTTTWNRFCEDVKTEESNISLMTEYGYKHGAIGVLNTNWGDWGNPCSLELAMYGLVLGAAKSWSAETKIDEELYHAVDFLLYEKENGMQYLKELSSAHDLIDWKQFIRCYFNWRYNDDAKVTPITMEIVESIQDAYKAFAEKLSSEIWKNDEYRQEMLISFEGLCVIAELFAKMLELPVSRVTDTKEWLEKYRQKWILKNKESELAKIEDVFLYCEEI